MTASEFHSDLLTPGIVTANDPPVTAPGMTYLELDQHGHLMYFEARPPGVLAAVKDSAVRYRLEPALSRRRARPVDPEIRGTGVDVALHIRCACGMDRDVAGQQPPDAGGSGGAARQAGGLLGARTVVDPAPTVSPDGSVFENPVFLIEVVLLFVILVGAPLMARKNLLRGRGDRNGALRLAGLIFVVQLALWLCRSHVIASLGTLGMLLLAICTATFAAVLVWTAYLALEPYVRRNWPRTLISSTSVLAGRIGDPVVGRDVLAGMLAAAVMLVMGHGLNAWVSQGQPHLTDTEPLFGLRGMLGALLQQVPYAVRNSLFFLFLLFLLRVLLRKEWAAVLAFAAIFTALTTHPGSHAMLEIGVALPIEAIMAVVLLRWGLLAGAVAYWLDNILDIPITTHTGAWYHGYAVAVLVVVAAMAGWALKTSMKGRRLLPRDLFS